MESVESLPALAGLGLVASFSPLLLSAGVVTLSAKKRYVRRTMPLVLGVLAAHTLVALVFLVVLVIPALRVIAHGASVAGRGALSLGNDLLAAFDPVLAVLCAAAGLGLVIWWRVKDYTPPRIDVSDRVGHKSLFTAGFLRSLLHISGIASLALAARISVRYGLLSPLLLILVVAVSVLPYVAIVALRVTSPPLFDTVRTLLKRLLALDPRLLTAAVLFAAAGYFAYRTLVGI